MNLAIKLLQSTGLKLTVLAFAVIAIVLWGVLNTSVRRGRAVRQIERAGGNVWQVHNQERLGMIGKMLFASPSNSDPVWFVDLEGTTFSDADAQILSLFGELECLSLSNTRITDSTLARVIADLHAIRDLSLSSNDVTDAGISQLRDLQFLTTLDVSFTSAGDGTMDLVSRSNHIQHLDVTGTLVSDMGFQSVSLACSLERLHAASTGLSDRSIQVIRQLRSLKYLDISDTKVTSESVSELARMPALEELWVHATALQECDIHQLRLALPGCRVIVKHDSYGRTLRASDRCNLSGYQGTR